MTTEAERRAAEREALLLAAEHGNRRLARPEDFVYDKAQNAYWDLVDGTLHVDRAVDASVPKEFWRVVTEAGDEDPDEDRDDKKPPKRGRPKAALREKLVPPSVDIRRVENDQLVEGTTWWPGHPRIIADVFVGRDGFAPAPGCRVYNQFRPAPAPVLAAAADAAPWVEHVRRLWPAEADYFFDYCAHMVQHPGVKCNTAIVLSGTQGIGKDAALWPVKEAVGVWNTRGIDPDALFSDYKPWVQTLMLVVDEVRPSKDEFHASSMYNILKPLIVTPPDTIPLNDKFEKVRYVMNVMRVFITTNDWMAMYVPPEDRRMFIMHSRAERAWHVAAGDPDYFSRFFEWMAAGGAVAVRGWLAARDLSAFRPKAEVPKTAGWHAVATTWDTPDDEVTAALERLDKPTVFFTGELIDGAFDNRSDMAALIKSPRKLGHRLQREGYVAVRPPNGRDRWKFHCAGRVFRSRLGWVKQTLDWSPAQIEAALMARGLALAEQVSPNGPHLKAI